MYYQIILGINFTPHTPNTFLWFQMDSEDGDSDYDEPVQILYDIVPYREWEQEPEVNRD